MAADLTLSGGEVVTAYGVRAADVRIADGRIVAITRPNRASGARLAVAGCLIFPGGIDPHTHLLADVRRATLAALHGGTTTAFTFPLPHAGESALSAFRRARRAIAGRALINVGLHASYLNPGRFSRRELETFASLGAFGVQAFQAFPELGLMFSPGELHRLLRAVTGTGLLAQVQCEDGSLIEELTTGLLASGQRDAGAFAASRPPEAEEQAVYRALSLGRLSAAPVYLVHLSTARSLALVAAARAAGQDVVLELCTHHLLLDEDAYREPRAARFIVAPPLRARSDVRALWRALRSGAVSVIASDHSQHQTRPLPDADFTQLPMGLPGVELRLPLMLSEGSRRGVPPPRLAQLLAGGAAEVFGIGAKKGTIAPGADADLVVWDPRPCWTVTASALHDGALETPYEGRAVQGLIRHVLIGGEVAVAEGELVATPAPALLERAAPGAVPA